jgi:hypothetical protein
MVEMRNAYTTLDETSEEKRPRGKHRRRWENNIRMDLSENRGKVRTGFIWLGIGTCEWMLLT